MAGCTLDGADLRGADVTGVDMDSAASLAGANLEGAIGVPEESPMTLGTDQHDLDGEAATDDARTDFVRG